VVLSNHERIDYMFSEQLGFATEEQTSRSTSTNAGNPPTLKSRPRKARQNEKRASMAGEYEQSITTAQSSLSTFPTCTNFSAFSCFR